MHPKPAQVVVEKGEPLTEFVSPVGDSAYVLRDSECLTLGYADVFTALVDALRDIEPKETRAEVLQKSEQDANRSSNEKPWVASVREWELSGLIDRLRRAEGLEALALYDSAGGLHALAEATPTAVAYALDDSRFVPLSTRQVNVVVTAIEGGFDITVPVIADATPGTPGMFSGDGNVWGFVWYRRRSSNAPETLCLSGGT